MDLIYIVLIVVGAVILLILAGLAIVNFSSDELLEKFNQTSKTQTTITPIDFAHEISHKFFKGSIKLAFTPNMLGDNFSSNGTLTLCTKYSTLNHLAGLSICAHELGHAFQFYFQKDKMKKYARKLKWSKFLSKLITPLLLAGIVLLILNYLIISLVIFGVAVAIFILAVAVKMSTIKIEKEASDKAIELLQEFTYLTDDEIQIAKDFLNSAKLTYIADLLKIMLKWTGFTRK